VQCAPTWPVLTLTRVSLGCGIAIPNPYPLTPNPCAESALPTRAGC
jgi:hypothetical protein